MNDKFGERRVWWEDGLIEKGVFIMPASLSKKTISPLWEVIITACRTEGKYRSGGTPMLNKVLIENVEFEVIENSIDQLLQQAAEFLDALTLEDLNDNWHEVEIFYEE